METESTQLAPFTYLLSPLDRLMLHTLLPREADFVTLKKARILREALSFTDAEVKAWNYREEDGQHKWEKFEEATEGSLPENLVESGGMTFDKSRPLDQDAEIYVGEVMYDRIAGMLKDKDKNGTLTENEMHLYEIFVGDQSQPRPRDGRVELKEA